MALGLCALQLKFTADGLGSDALCLEPDEFTVGQVLIDSIFFEVDQKAWSPRSFLADGCAI